MTPEIVDNLKEKYEKLSAEEYDVEKIVNGVVDVHSPEVENLVKIESFFGKNQGFVRTMSSFSIPLSG